MMRETMLLITLTRLAMTLGAIFLVYRLAAADRAERDGAPARQNLNGYWILNLVLLSVALHLSFLMSPKPWVIVHEHDIFHYYMGSKYSEEVGYLDLYQCATVAESENLGEDPKYAVRKMDDYTFISSTRVLERADEYRALFTPERWEEFRGDVAVFGDKMQGGDRLKPIFRDNGYNATPAWNMIARPISNLISVQWPPGLLLLASFDTLLLILGFVAVGRTFDKRTALLAVIVLGTLVTMADGTIRGAYLRLDWLVALLLATCALKRERYKTAGALVAFAGMVRVFPLVFLFGLGAKAAWDLLATRRLNRRYVEFFVVVALVTATLFGLSASVGGSLDDWQTFWEKISFHDGRMSALRVGFKTLFLAAVSPFMENWPADSYGRSARAGEVQALLRGVQGLALVAAFFAVRRLKDYETIPFGWVLVYFLAAPTHYYQIVLLPFSLLFLPKLIERVRLHGIALLLGASALAYMLWIRQNADQGFSGPEWDRFDYPLSVSLSGILLLVALYALGFSYFSGLPRRAEASSGSGASRLTAESETSSTQDP